MQIQIEVIDHDTYKILLDDRYSTTSLAIAAALTQLEKIKSTSINQSWEEAKAKIESWDPTQGPLHLAVSRTDGLPGHSFEGFTYEP